MPEHPPPNPPPSPRAAMWAEYRRLRRMYWRTWLLFVLLMIPFAFLLIFKPKSGSALALVVGYPTILMFLGCLVTNLALWIKLVSFRCPRCGTNFTWTWSWAWPGNYCLNCGLPIDS